MFWRTLASPHALFLLVGMVHGGCNFSFNPSVDNIDPELDESTAQPAALDAGEGKSSREAAVPPPEDASLLCDSGCSRVVCPGCDGGDACNDTDACVERCAECEPHPLR